MRDTHSTVMQERLAQKEEQLRILEEELEEEQLEVRREGKDERLISGIHKS
tara:strand:+ start:771 stop:923 length:153 start_codon:yes stop_codon:yes gene_type:complete